MPGSLCEKVGPFNLQVEFFGSCESDLLAIGEIVRLFLAICNGLGPLVPCCPRPLRSMEIVGEPRLLTSAT